VLWPTGSLLRIEAGPTITFYLVFFYIKKKVGKFGEKPFVHVWEFLLGGDTSKKRIKKFTRKNHHGGSPAPPRVPDLVCKISFAFPEFLVAVVHLIFIGGIFYRRRSVDFRVVQGRKRGVG
jgi:hypothetical protein